MNRIKIPQPVSGGLILSYKCSAACRHCMYACSPRWQGDWMSEQNLENCLAILAGKIVSPYGSHVVSLNYGLHFTGGEPFLKFELLVRAAQIAEELKIPSTFVETNCFWCRTDKETREKLQLLKNSGLKGIMISVNPFYAEYVPFERTERCLRMSLEVFGNNVMVYQLEYYRRFRQMGLKERISLEDFIRRTPGESLTENVELFLMGKATHQFRNFYPAYPAQHFLHQPCQPPILREWHNHFDNYGNFMPGFCGGISLGQWRNLDRMIKDGIHLDEQPVLGYLLADDMPGLYRFAADYGYQASPEGYVSRCDLCLDLRKYLVSKQDFKELSPKAFYQHLDESGNECYDLAK